MQGACILVSTGQSACKLPLPCRSRPCPFVATHFGEHLSNEPGVVPPDQTQPDMAFFSLSSDVREWPCSLGPGSYRSLAVLDFPIEKLQHSWTPASHGHGWVLP